MSVSLFNGNEAAKIAENFQSEETQRKIWYAYISNVTAYNTQYRENEPIQFESWEANTDKFESIHEAVYNLAGLLYNACTNAGNSFAPSGVIEDLYEMVEIHKDRADYKEWLYDQVDNY